MRPLKATLAGLLAGALLLQAGCKDKRKQISTPKYLLSKQHEAWREARETLKSDQPNLGVFRAVNHYLRFRTPTRVKKAYTGDDKQQILEKLEELGKAYEENIYQKLDTRGNEVRLAQGVTLEQLRQAFNKLDEQYRKLESMTGGG